MSVCAIIDYGMGNLHSISKALQHVGGHHTIHVTSDIEQIKEADRVVFPGVGAIRDCMQELDKHGLTNTIQEVAKEKPFLGICLGMQAMMDFSEENNGIDCLGLIPGKVQHFAEHLDQTTEKYKIPHMGWNQVEQSSNHPLWHNIAQNSHFYFVHSYYACPTTQTHTAGTTDYGINFCSVVSQNNLFGVQFHPEKSQHAGLKLLENFLTWNG